jgi:hypothetical protein
VAVGLERGGLAVGKANWREMLVEENGIGWGELYCTAQARLIDKE